MSIISGSINMVKRHIVVPCDIAPNGSVLIVRETLDKQTSVLIKRCMALIDTGATNTCISADLAKEMNLQHDGLSDMITAGGIAQSKLYLVDLILNFVDHHVPIESLRVSEVVLPKESDFHVILGMDVILRGHMSISRDSHFLFAL
jgi:predicted aspartyl protease